MAGFVAVGVEYDDDHSVWANFSSRKQSKAKARDKAHLPRTSAHDYFLSPARSHFLKSHTPKIASAAGDQDTSISYPDLAVVN